MARRWQPKYHHRCPACGWLGKRTRRMSSKRCPACNFYCPQQTEKPMDRRAFTWRLQQALDLFHVNEFEKEAVSGNPIPRQVSEAIDAGMTDDDVAKILVTAYRSAKEDACSNLEAATKARKDRVRVPVKRMDR